MTFHYKSRLIFLVVILFTITYAFSVQAATDSEPPLVLEQSVSPGVIAFKGNATPGWEKFDQGEISIQNGEHNMPTWRMKEIVTNSSFAQPSFSPNGDGVNDIVTGTMTISEDVKVSLWMVNAVNIHIKNLGSFEGAGTHSFTWDGTEFMGGTVINGPYSLKVSVYEGPEQGYIISEDSVRVAGDNEIIVPNDAQEVRVIKDNPKMEGFFGQPYTGGKKGDIYQILGFINYDYRVLLAEGATGTINAADVELLNIDSTPLQEGKIVKETPAYEGPTSFSKEIETLPAESLFRILRKDGTYYRIQLDSERQGYVHQDNITIVEKTEFNSKNQTFHIVKSGDMLWQIAEKYQTTIDKLVQLNQLVPNGYLYIGQILSIPPVLSESNENEKDHVFTYTVQSGDTLWKIAQKYNVLLDQFIQTNNLDPSQYLFIGQKLIIQQPIQKTEPANLYTVQSGDTLWKIANKHNTTIQNLTQLNGLIEVDYIYSGQQLKFF